MEADKLVQDSKLRSNRLLNALSGEDLERLEPHLRLIDMPGGQCVSTLSNGGHGVVACFPVSLVASIVEVMADGTRVTVGLIGREGMLGWPAMLGPVLPPQTGIVQMNGGAALTITADALMAACRASRTLRYSLVCFFQSYTTQMSYTIVANMRDAIEQRLSRWLLMLHDRIDGDVLPITHGELAAALHVRRASVTDTLHLLEGERLIRCTRGRITVRDRDALARIAGTSYGPPEESYRALVGLFGKG